MPKPSRALPHAASKARHHTKLRNGRPLAQRRFRDVALGIFFVVLIAVLLLLHPKVARSGWAANVASGVGHGRHRAVSGGGTHAVEFQYDNAYWDRDYAEGEQGTREENALLPHTGQEVRLGEEEQLTPAVDLSADDEDDPFRDPSIPQLQSTTVKAQLLVLGYHNTGTSLVAKLLLLMGAYGGSRKSLFIGETNRLKFYERFDLVNTNRWVMQQLMNVTQQREAQAYAAGYDWTRLPQPARQGFESRARTVLDALNTRPVWVAKDPRMCLTLQMWMPLLSRPVCVLVYRHPVRVAFRLVGHKTKSQMGDYEVKTFLAQWERHMIASLMHCRGKPVVIVPAELASVPHHRVLVGYMLKELLNAGVPGLRVPSAKHVREQYEQYFDGDDVAVGPKYDGVLNTCHGYVGLAPEDAAGRDLRRCTLKEMLSHERAVEIKKVFALSDGGPAYKYTVRFAVELSPRQAALVQVLEQTLERAFSDRLQVQRSNLSEFIFQRIARILYQQQQASAKDKG